MRPSTTSENPAPTSPCSAKLVAKASRTPSKPGSTVPPMATSTPPGVSTWVAASSIVRSPRASGAGAYRHVTGATGCQGCTASATRSSAQAADQGHEPAHRPGIGRGRRRRASARRCGSSTTRTCASTAATSSTQPAGTERGRRHRRHAHGRGDHGGEDRVAHPAEGPGRSPERCAHGRRRRCARRPPCRAGRRTCRRCRPRPSTAPAHRSAAGSLGGAGRSLRSAGPARRPPPPRAATNASVAHHSVDKRGAVAQAQAGVAGAAHLDGDRGGRAPMSNHMADRATAAMCMGLL